MLRSALPRSLTALGLLLVLALPAPAALAQSAPVWEVERIYGPDATTGAVTLAHRLVPYSQHVVLARADDYADALTGGPLAAALGAPMLLTASGSLHDEVADEIRRLRATHVILLGGPAALSPAVEQAVRDAGVADVQRVMGANRFATAAAVAAILNPGGSDRVYLARGGDAEPTRGWPDAVAVAALAAQTRTPILLSDFDGVPQPTADALAALGVSHATVVGGSAVLTENVPTQLRALGLDVDRLSGDSRFSTSLAIADRALSGAATPRQTWLVGGGSWADALVAGPLVASTGGVLLLTDGTHWETSGARAWLRQHAAEVEKVWLVGSPGALPTAVDFDLGDQASPPPAPPAGGAVTLQVGDDFQQVISQHDPGTHFRIAAGVHRLQVVQPRENDRFTGDPGAVMSGAVPLDAGAFQPRDGLWVLGGQHYESVDLHNPEVELLPGFERDAAEHDLWSGSTRLRHVGSRAELAQPGSWLFDYSADEIVLSQDPATLGPLELSVSPTAFESAASGVTIEHLRIERYATRAQHGAISAGDGSMWTIRHVEVTQNHAGGIRTGPGARVEFSRITHNGSVGVSGTDRTWNGPRIPTHVEFNEIAFNRELGYYWLWEGGGIKLGDLIGAVVRGNWLHHNGGVGMWCDVGCVGVDVLANRVESNQHGGILYELSSDGDISGNLVRGNGALAYGDQGGGIWLSNSGQVKVIGNVVEANRFAFMAVQAPNQEGAIPVIGLSLIGNDLRVDGYALGYRIYTDDRSSLAAANHTVSGNRYRIAPGRTDAFYWGAVLDVAGWQALGFDTDGQFVGIDQPAAPSYDIERWAPYAVGA